MCTKWLDIVDYEGHYQVSSCGKVRSFKRKEPKILKQTKTHDDYHYVTLSLNNQQKKVYVARLVAEHFIPNPFNKPEVNHKNGIKSDNGEWNLEWSTRTENQRHADVNGLSNRPTLKGENNGYSKLTEEEVKDIREYYSTGNFTYVELAKLFDVSKSLIAKIVNRECWTHI